MLQEKEGYRSVTVRLVPTPRQAKILDRNLQRVSRFLNIAEGEFRKLIVPYPCTLLAITGANI